MDAADAAQKRQSDVIKDIILRLQHNRPETSKPSARYCTMCGEEIPEKRRLTVPGCSFCIECQQELEG